MSKFIHANPFIKISHRNKIASPFIAIEAEKTLRFAHSLRLRKRDKFSERQKYCTCS